MEKETLLLRCLVEAIFSAIAACNLSSPLQPTFGGHMRCVFTRFECSCPRFGSEPRRSPSLEPGSSFDPRSWGQAISRALPRFGMVPRVFHSTDASWMVLDFIMTFCIFDHLPRKMAKICWTRSYSIPPGPCDLSWTDCSIASHQLPAVTVQLKSRKY